MSRTTPFRKLLIANRGEIAVRILRTAKRLGYRTVAVFSEADQRARHAREADQAVAIGPAVPAQSYLRVDRIIDAALRSGADAVHPGYGFLSENAGFSRACREAGLVFIGPSPEAIAAMGDKAAAKRLMVAAGVPCIPGDPGDSQDPSVLAAAAERIGFPIMVKALAGGGGRGMRLVSSAGGFVEALRAARLEAGIAFGDERVMLERALTGARHVEVQVFADRYGNAVHMGERDCSVQRRHQKLIEEAPSPAVDIALRARMGDTAVAAVRAIGYEGAGTVEFLLDGDGQFFFMEMNTRLQVEHPVTEAVTGLDLVEWQLRVAAGERLPLSQSEIRISGHAIEVRLCAEDPHRGFMPQSGRLDCWRVALGVRTDDALESGMEISPHYDSMLAKLVSHGATRDEARRRLAMAIDDTVTLGFATNREFLRCCIEHPTFVAGEAATDFIERNLVDLMEDDADFDAHAHAIGAALLYATAGDSDTPTGGGRISHRLPIAFRFESEDKAGTATLIHHGGHRFEVELGGYRHELVILELDRHDAVVATDGLNDHVVFVRRGNRLSFQFRGVGFSLVDRTHAVIPRQEIAGGDARIRAAMNGRIVAVHVAVGDIVAAGQPVLSLEAMKMEHVHAAPVAGRIASLHVAMGDQVAAFRVLAEIVVAGAPMQDV